MSDLLKDSLYTPDALADFAAALHAADSNFDKEAFLARVFDTAWESLELKQRMRHITLLLHDMLPADYAAALATLREAARRFNQEGWLSLNFCDFVEVYGLDNWDLSLPALEQFTQLGSAEFAVRPFLAQDQPRMLAQMQRWAQHEQATVRRLASEGCRPRLPWGMGLPTLKKDPAPILPILDLLKTDESEDVRRSVANNLNDISKDHPQVVIDSLRRWQTVEHEDMAGVTRHALRTLLKAGHAEALALLGYGPPALAIRDFKLEPAKIKLGESITFSFQVESCGSDTQELMVDYVLHLVGAGGNTREKVFKLSKLSLSPGDRVRIEKTQPLKPITTRRYYSGEHHIEIQINGQRYDRRSFWLEV